ncbi:MAG: hypothetical protein WAW61_12580 [Methylococcaceae bacterium]
MSLPPMTLDIRFPADMTVSALIRQSSIKKQPAIENIILFFAGKLGK